MDITLSLQRAVRGFHLGTAALAAYLRISEHTLNHKVSPTYPGAKCSVEEAAAICEATGDMGPLHAFAARLSDLTKQRPCSWLRPCVSSATFSAKFPRLWLITV